MSHPMWAILGTFCNGDLRDEVLVTCEKYDDDEVAKQHCVEKFKNLKGYFTCGCTPDMSHHVPEGIEEAIENRQERKQ